MYVGQQVAIFQQVLKIIFCLLSFPKMFWVPNFAFLDEKFLTSGVIFWQFPTAQNLAREQ